jgi:hypothetical protein
VKVALSVVGVGMVIAGATVPPSNAAGRLHVHRARQGDVRAELTYRTEGGRIGYWVGARLKIWNAGALVVDRRLGPYATFSGRRPLAVRQLDGTRPAEVLLTLYTGGTHCCSESWVYTGAHRARMGWGHVAAATVRDADGDGKPEFHWYDTSWAYAFASFAGSAFPAKVWSYYDGGFHDVTKAFPAEVQADQAAHYAAYQDAVAEGNPEGVRAALAAYTADGYTLGQGDAAMVVLQAAVDAGETGNGVTHADPNWMPDYVAVVRKALRERGYTS